MLVVVVGAASARAQSTEEARPVVLPPGDSLRVVVLRVVEVSGTFLVASDSSLSFPVYQGIKVAGIPMTAVRERIRPLLVPYQREPEFSIAPLLRIAVGGEVRLPHVYFFPPEMTIGGAVDYAGGPSDRGNLAKVRLIRDGRETTFDFTNPAGPAEFVTLRSGDRIIVSKRPNVLGVLGPLASLVAIGTSIVVIIRH